LLRLPPYAPELNPAENIWDEIREKFFGNIALIPIPDPNESTGLHFG
jgi:transposase